ncbi:MAG: MiaB/RimO family radical SAM methylthiotransferase [Candidatus Omnitrophica bacterium]|nr:MiaB/RimO family radical SAM methylthiotransferase [Candidatus Omnitrophota bacterium]
MRPRPGYKVGILSLGCPRNLVDSESILSRLCFKKGISIVDIEKADVALVNTCAFIREAKVESIDAILDLVALKKEGKLKKVIVYGCLTQRYKEKLARELPEVDAFVGRVSLDCQPRRFSLSPAHYAYLKICESCVNNCSYCVIPRIKGDFVSLGPDSVLGKIKELDRAGVREVNIIGQDISSWGLDLYKKPALSRLLRLILKEIKNIHWLRLLYLYPTRLDDALLGLIKNEPVICKYIDLPLQHINDRILRLMHRNTAKREILSLLCKIRKKIPGIGLRTSLIVGFPSETDKEFRELLDFIKEARFERLGAFIYSREEGTAAYTFPGQVPEKIKRERLDELMRLQQQISCDINAGFKGKTMEVLIDEKEKDHYLARSRFDAPEVDGIVYVRSKKDLRPGDFVPVKITDTLEYDLVGETR